MIVSGHRKSIAFFITLGSCVVALAIALNIGWIVLNWRTGVLLILGVLFFALIITGVVLNTIFLVREIRRNEQHNTFINAVTHELKTPVASIRLYLETLQTREITESKRQEFYRIMLEDNDRLLRTIEQVLTAGRTGSADRPLNRTFVDLRALVQECVELARMRHRLPAESFHFANAPQGPNHPTVLGDLDELKTAVSNLLDNAIKYSGPTVHVRVEIAEAEAGRLAIRVKDEGVGIPRNELKRIFKRFYRIPGKSAMGVKGTGLGLFIVRSVAAKHGGKAYAESEGAGHGSTFTLQLPCAPRQ
ncbi:MAG TPA: HAMP domain-containing sensor histidine kinase [Bryobacteraceae bacterium]|nr:HAMP domain-containing sensor histidine kinase [Bryobacteraceae bacterium]